MRLMKVVFFFPLSTESETQNYSKFKQKGIKRVKTFFIIQLLRKEACAKTSRRQAILNYVSFRS
jgi:hypothetical protein